MEIKTLFAAVAIAMGCTTIASADGSPTPPPSLGPNVTNTSNKGSLLIFPLINIDPAYSADTRIQISNDEITPVIVECEYVNQQKARVDFIFSLSGKATASWAVGAQIGDTFTPPTFPGTGPYPAFGNSFSGELVCFAVNNLNKSNAIVFNHLHGTATVNAVGSAIKYSPWTFRGYDASGNPTNEGAPIINSYGAGALLLEGGLGSDYDACPLYETTSFVPNGAALGNVTTSQNYLAVSTCNQDLRLNFNLHTTNLVFSAFNANEVGYSDANICVDSTVLIPLIDGNTNLVDATNFDYGSLGTAGASYAVQGVPANSSTCPQTPFGQTEAAGLLGVAASYIQVKGGSPGLIAGNLYSAGSQFGYVQWDAGPSSAPNVKKR